MAREQANLRLDIWIDQDWRDLTVGEQWLYTTLLSHTSLSYAGVGDWRPGRLAPMAADLDADPVKALAHGLEAKRFIVIDEETEEVLIRSFLKHDGLLKQPKLAVSMVNAFGGVASDKLRRVIIHELRKLRENYPDWKGLQHERVIQLCDQPASPAEDFTPAVTPELTPPFTHRFTPSFTPELTPPLTPNGGQAQGLRTATTTATTTSISSEIDGGSGGKSPARRLPDDWAPTEAHAQKATEKGLSLEREAENFRLHARANDRRQVQWNAAFTMWLNKSSEYAGTRPPSATTPDDGIPHYFDPEKTARRNERPSYLTDTDDL